MAVDMGSAVAHLLLDTAQFNQAINEAKGGLEGAGTLFSSVGSTMTSSVTNGFVKAGKAAFSAASDFESAMSQIQATRGITSDAMEELNGQAANTMDAYSELAQEFGRTTKFSATEAAEAINNMAMAGYSLQQTYDTLPTVLSLASAGALDLDYATQLVANGLNAMGLETKDSTELADKLAVTASNAYGSVADFGEGILKAGGQAQLANVSLTDTMTALGILGDNGISASEGGTMLRNVLKNLYTPTNDAAKALAELGVQTADDNGQLLDFQTVLQDLGSALDGLSEEDRINAMARIFDTRTIAGANALIDASGDRWDELSLAIDGAGGAAQRMADTQLNNVEGRLTILKSSIESLLISLGNLLLPVIERVVASVQNVVKWMNSLDDDTKQMILRIAAVVAAIGPVLTIVGRVISVISLVDKAIGGLKTVISGIGTVLSSPIGQIALIIAAIVAVIEILKKLYTECEGFRNFVDGVVAWLKQAAIDIGQFFVETLPAAIGSAIEWLKNFFANVAEVFSGAWETISQFVVNLWESFVTGIQNVIATVVNFFSNLWHSITSSLSTASNAVSSFISKVVSFFTQLPTKIASGLKQAYNKVTTWVGDVTSKMSSGVSGAISTVVNFFAGLPSKIGTGLSSAYENVSTWASNVYNSAVTGVSNMVSSVVSSIASLPGKFAEWFGSVVSYLKGINLTSIGKSIMNSLFDGLKSIWNSIKSWFNGLSLNWNKFSKGAGNVRVEGAYATGLDFVPRTMAVTVHRGERILTQKENEEYNRGGSVEVVTYQNDEAVKSLSDTMNRLLVEVGEIKKMGITLDSKRLVGGLVGEMDRQLGLRAARV